MIEVIDIVGSVHAIRFFPSFFLKALDSSHIFCFLALLQFFPFHRGVYYVPGYS